MLEWKQYQMSTCNSSIMQNPTCPVTQCGLQLSCTTGNESSASEARRSLGGVLVMRDTRLRLTPTSGYRCCNSVGPIPRCQASYPCKRGLFSAQAKEQHRLMPILRLSAIVLTHPVAGIGNRDNQPRPAGPAHTTVHTVCRN